MIMLFFFFLQPQHRLSALKARIQDARTRSPLFDAKRYAADMEKLLRKMWDRYEKGLPAEHILS